MTFVVVIVKERIKYIFKIEVIVEVFFVVKFIEFLICISMIKLIVLCMFLIII